MGLAEYKRKRDFKKTAEPAGKPLPKAVRGACRFVIQKHDARRLHYDFRLQMEGVLKSWAVPKGLPWKKGEKHLAVEVEDHPIEYEAFEGVIPEGEYGGGTVMVWDRGAYYVYGEQPLKSLREGKLHLVLEGKESERRMDAGANSRPGRRKEPMVDFENRSGRQAAVEKSRGPVGHNGPDNEANRGRSRCRVGIEPPGRENCDLQIQSAHQRGG